MTATSMKRNGFWLWYRRMRLRWTFEDNWLKRGAIGTGRWSTTCGPATWFAVNG